ncbi:MBL fold metallo-hydrolase RNA specificity domain-containing protein [Halochromatium glycolicum]|uniref:MBL fold metallo-hydrolase RNA specificity domain-containing protein n=1 Tax=Halochromatium glycolicum TaxID=85075 RepID=UPI003B82EC39
MDCGLFQGDEAGDDGARADQLQIGFDIAPIQALIITHVHIDHVGRLPHLLAAGYQAKGPPGRDIQRYGPRGGYVMLDGERYDIRAQIHTIGGYSAHADQRGLIEFATGIPTAPAEIRLVHGDEGAKTALAGKLRDMLKRTEVVVPAPYRAAAD